MSKPRSIFEEVATTEKATPAATGRIDAKGQGARGAGLGLVGLIEIDRFAHAGRVEGLARAVDTGIVLRGNRGMGYLGMEGRGYFN